MEGARKPLTRREQLYQIFGHVHRLERADPHSLYCCFIDDAPQQFAQFHARLEIATVVSEIDPAQHDFARAVFRQFTNFFERAFGRKAPAASAHLRNHAVGAPAIASILNFQHGPRVARSAAFDRRKNKFSLFQNISGKNSSRTALDRNKSPRDRRNRFTASDHREWFTMRDRCEWFTASDCRERHESLGRALWQNR